MSLKRILFEDMSTDNLNDYEIDQDIAQLDLHYYRGWEADKEHELYDVIRKFIEEAKKIFTSKIDVFEKIVVRTVKSLENPNHLAEYSHESALKLKPYIILSFEAVINSFEEGYALRTIVLTTLFHEFAHAMVDLDNAFIFKDNENIFEFQDEEKFVEDFAYKLFEYNKIDPVFKEFEQEAKKLKDDNHNIEFDENYY